MKQVKLKVAAAICAWLVSSSSFAQLSVSKPWARATVGAQKVTGVFMDIRSEHEAVLIGAETPAAGLVEIHEMRMDGNMMRMRQLTALSLPAGQTVALQPGGYHLMLLDLKRPLSAGTTIPVTLRVRDAAGVLQKLEIKAEVRGLDGAPIRH
ncbi:MAG TPA: copper chaperone PCu(A)C [Burkholderiales bacterium]|nr:copper chaperone PCu(A)C [Burkholderiales bacterium]